jgi:phosphoglycolate phosphatase-like HAD superfamily hydrolase
MAIYYNQTLMKKLQAYRLFLFDLDRTLVETEWDYLLQIVHLVIERCGGKFVPTREQIQHFWIGNTMSRDEFIKHVLRLSALV